MKVLGVDATGHVASCALVEEGDLIAEAILNVGLKHSETLLLLIEQLLNSAKCTVRDLDCISVSIGPGSFTGIRIGVATVKGLAFPHDIPCCGVSTLEALASQVFSFDGLVCPVMDARQSQVYNALFEQDGEKLLRLTPDRALPIDELLDELCSFKKPVCFTGDAADLCQQRKPCEVTFFALPGHARMQRAAAVALLCNPNNAVSADALIPSYLRVPQAERVRRQKHSQAEERLSGTTILANDACSTAT